MTADVALIEAAYHLSEVGRAHREAQLAADEAEDTLERAQNKPVPSRGELQQARHERDEAQRAVRRMSKHLELLDDALSRME